MSGFERAMNKVPDMILRSPLHGLISKSVLLITFTGRRSGKKYTTPITYVREGDTFLMTTESPWWKNLRGGTYVGLRVEGQEHAAHGKAITDEAEVARVMETFTRKFPRYDKYAGMETDSESRVTPAAIEKAARERVVVRARVNPKSRKEMTDEDTENY